MKIILFIFIVVGLTLALTEKQDEGNESNSTKPYNDTLPIKEISSKNAEKTIEYQKFEQGERNEVNSTKPYNDTSTIKDTDSKNDEKTSEHQKSEIAKDCKNYTSYHPKAKISKKTKDDSRDFLWVVCH